MGNLLYDLCRDWAAKPIIKLMAPPLKQLGGLMPTITDPLANLGGWLESDGGLHVVTVGIVVTVALLIGLTNLIMLVYIERKLLGRLMDRRGPMLSLASTWVDPKPETAAYSFSGYGFLQNIADGLKLFQKELIVPEKADKLLYSTAPVIIVASSVLLVALVPISDRFAAFSGQAGLLFVMAVFAIAPLGILAGGWASNNKFTLIGGMRSAAQLMSYEIPLLLSMAAVFLAAGSFNPLHIVEQQQAVTWLGIPMWNIVPMFIGFFVFMVAILAEVERIPFDLPEAESELVEGWTTEYGGMRFGLFLAAEYLRGFIGAAVAVILFLGGWAGPNLPLEFPITIAGVTIPTILVFGIGGMGGLGFLLGPAFAKPKATARNQLKWGGMGLVAGMLIGAILAMVMQVVFPYLQAPLGLPDLEWAFTMKLPGPELWFIAKVWLLFVFFVMLRGTLPRIRTDQILELGWKRLLPLSLLNLLVVIGLGLGYEVLHGGGWI